MCKVGFRRTAQAWPGPRVPSQRVGDRPWVVRRIERANGEVEQALGRLVDPGVPVADDGRKGQLRIGRPFGSLLSRREIPGRDHKDALRRPPQFIDTYSYRRKAESPRRSALRDKQAL